VGSFLRPERLLAAARRLRAGEIAEAEFRALQDECVTEIVRFQERLGLQSITDGEFRRRSWSAGFIDAIPAFGYREGALGSFRSERGAVVAVAQNPYARAPLKRVRGIATGEFAFLKSVVRQGVPKVTLPSPPVMHFFLGPRAVDEAVYPDLDRYFDDLVRIYREEVAELAAAGCRYLQLDDTALPCLCDPAVQDEVRRRGEDPQKLLATYARVINAAIAERPRDMVVAMHLCRGNLKGAWMAEGGYDPIAQTLFNDLGVDGYLLEYDTPRAGDFGPLARVPKGKTVVLGLLSTKTPALESPEALKRRIDEAARQVPLEQLALSPQCGFSSAAGGGQVITPEDTERKVRLMQAVAAEVWGRS
ncbi:MAG TPA: 5-methyltetrahydropteroyltriglutamate--homocysteine S-methyltransferase, partial [Burkholderiales bacterium]|nr:5-methyltetrahydropteroyltriglutamate--homocysteine S-methyltransferase [Burkholderiales bacterium]